MPLAMVSMRRVCAWFVVCSACACTPSAPEQFSWRLALDSTGGNGGGGNGNVVVTSDGEVESSRMGRSCKVTLGRDELSAVQQAVGAIAPGKWQAEYLPARREICCGRTTWRLNVTLRAGDGTERTAHTEWHESAIDQLPPDLGTLATVAQRVLDFSLKQCERG